MGKFQNEIQSFRHRGFQPNDDSPTVMIFGNEAGPVNKDGSAMTKLWDHDVEQIIHVMDHVDPVATVDAGTIADPVAPTPA